MATNHTENYNLNLWEPNDSFIREEFNQDNAKIDALLLGKPELIQEYVPTLTGRNSYDIDLSDIDWNKWEIVCVVFQYPSVYGKEMTVSVNMYVPGSTNLGKEAAGSRTAIFFPHHSADTPIRFLVFPNGEFGFSAHLFSELTTFSVHSAAYLDPNEYAAVRIFGLR